MCVCVCVRERESCRKKKGCSLGSHKAYQLVLAKLLREGGGGETGTERGRERKGG